MKAGFTGYGTRATSKFPPDIPHLLGKEENRQSMKMVDNAYVLFTLRFGWLGCGALILLLCTSVFCCWTLYAERPDQWFAAAMGAMLFVYTTFSLNLVWQSYDVEFTNAVQNEEGQKVKNAVITLRHNGVVIHENQEIGGPTGGHRNEPEGTPGPIKLQGHGNPLQFRNIWIVKQ